MKTFTFDNEESWLAFRKGKISGTRLKDIIVKRGSSKKIGFYELIAERLAVAADEENPMERGKRLQEEAIARFVKERRKKVNTDLVMWTRDDDENIAVSPDGKISESEAVEVKCLSSARHIEAYLTQEIPDEYYFQTLQYFIVNDKLKKLHVVFYDPRFTTKDFFVITLERNVLGDLIDEYLEYQRRTLEEVNETVARLLLESEERSSSRK